MWGDYIKAALRQPVSLKKHKKCERSPTPAFRRSVYRDAAAKLHYTATILQTTEIIKPKTLSAKKYKLIISKYGEWSNKTNL